MSKHSAWRLRDGDPLTEELTIGRLLGGGSSYEAYLAYDDITLAPVIVKVVRPELVDDRRTLRSLRREAANLTKVNHPGMARLLRWWEPERGDGQAPEGSVPAHLVLELVDGPRLSSLIRRNGALTPQQYLPLAIDLASVAHYLRHVDVVHLDIKPSNVIMGAPAKLIDLSVARDAAAAAGLTAPIGTDDYMAPEQCDPPTTGVPGYPSDVWGIGATLFQAVAGYRAFPDVDLEAEDPVRRYPQLAYAAGELSLREIPREVDIEVHDVLRACLDPDPALRPAPRDIADSLEPVLLRQPRAKLTNWKVS